MPIANNEYNMLPEISKCVVIVLYSLPWLVAHTVSLDIQYVDKCIHIRLLLQ